MHRKIILFILLLCMASLSFAQSYKKRNQKDAMIELSKSLEEGKSDEQLAKDYEKLAREFAEAEEYAKAEENYRKVRDIYIKLKDTEKIAFVERELAKLQESQNKIGDAILNYRSASNTTKDVTRQSLNISDAQRLMNQSNSLKQSELINQKIELLEENDYRGDEISTAYMQMAQVNMELNQPEEAISNYQAALTKVEKPEDEIKINREIANIYLNTEQKEKAVIVNEELVKKARETSNPNLEIEQLQNLSSAYFQNSDNERGLQSLLEAYQLSLDRNQTFEAKRSAELLADYYKKNKKSDEALKLYADFFDKLDFLIQSDSSLVDKKIFQANEEKIIQLERERALKDELIRKKNTFNYFLIFLIFLILIFVFFIIRTLFSIRTKNKKIALQSLRREMNPHFIFNSLNSVNQFIAQNNELEANKYLSSYSKLMRTTMENSNKDFIPLSLEIQQMKEYLQLEYLRFSDKFNYEVIVDEDLDKDNILVPNMLIQPNLENAIWHGLRYRDGKGSLQLKIYEEQNYLYIIIEDDGIGILQSKKLKTARQKEHESRGLSNTYERIELLNQLYHCDINLDVRDKEGEESGVVVTIRIPLDEMNKRIRE